MSKTCIQTALAALAFAAAAFAQTPPGAPAGPTLERRIMLHSEAGGDNVTFMVAEMGPGGKAIKGAPYSASVVTEVVQVLGDGNKIRRETTGAVYRDSEGRTRNEPPAPPIGPMAPAGLRQIITITDPVAGVSYVLNPEDKTAIKRTLSGMARRAPAGTVMHASGTVVAHAGGGGGAAGVIGYKMIDIPDRNTQDVKTEQLGTKVIEGVQAEGTRVTTTIPAGTIGNERAIETVSERWYSPQLQLMVMTTHSDPRMGTNTYRLARVSLGEPDHSLFEVPAGYTIKEGPEAGEMMIRHRAPAPKRQE